MVPGSDSGHGAMTAQSELYTAIKARIEADTGAGGTAEADGVAQIKDIVRESTSERTPQRPYVRVNLPGDDEMDSFGVDGFGAAFSFVIVTDRDREHPSEDAIRARLRFLFHHTDITTTTYGVSTLQRLRGFRAPGTDGKELEWVEEYAAIGRTI